MVCKHCSSRFRPGPGTSNLHKHLKASHPDVDRSMRYIPAPGESEEGQDDYYDGSLSTQYRDSLEEASLSSSVQTIVAAPPPPKEKRTSKRPPLFISASKHVSVSEVATPVQTEVEKDDLPTQQILNLIKQINSDQAQLKNQVNSNQAELQNQQLQQQFESQRQLRLIEKLKKEVKSLKRGRKSNGVTTYDVDDDDEDDLPKFPLYRMSQVDDVEEQLFNDAEFKERLARLFKAGQADKVDSILSWFSNELLVQFTYREDRDSLATHRSTNLSEIFELMFSEYSRRGDIQI